MFGISIRQYLGANMASLWENIANHGATDNIDWADPQRGILTALGFTHLINAAHERVDISKSNRADDFTSSELLDANKMMYELILEFSSMFSNFKNLNGGCDTWAGSFILLPADETLHAFEELETYLSEDLTTCEISEFSQFLVV